MRVSRVLFLFVAMVAIGMGLVTLRAETQQAGFAIGKLQVRQVETKRLCLEREAEVAQLRSPLRLATENTQLALELNPPGPPALAKVKEFRVARAGH